MSLPGKVITAAPLTGPVPLSSLSFYNVNLLCFGAILVQVAFLTGSTPEGNNRGYHGNNRGNHGNNQINYTCVVLV